MHRGAVVNVLYLSLTLLNRTLSTCCSSRDATTPVRILSPSLPRRDGKRPTNTAPERQRKSLALPRLSDARQKSPISRSVHSGPQLAASQRTDGGRGCAEWCVCVCACAHVSVLDGEEGDGGGGHDSAFWSAARRSALSAGSHARDDRGSPRGLFSHRRVIARSPGASRRSRRRRVCQSNPLAWRQRHHGIFFFPLFSF